MSSQGPGEPRGAQRGGSVWQGRYRQTIMEEPSMLQASAMEGSRTTLMSCHATRPPHTDSNTRPTTRRLACLWSPGAQADLSVLSLAQADQSVLSVAQVDLPPEESLNFTQLVLNWTCWTRRRRTKDDSDEDEEGDPTQDQEEEEVEQEEPADAAWPSGKQTWCYSLLQVNKHGVIHFFGKQTSCYLLLQVNKHGLFTTSGNKHGVITSQVNTHGVFTSSGKQTWCYSFFR
nr:uncharacterized protein LOC112072497 [Salvelinus alpinus]